MGLRQIIIFFILVVTSLANDDTKRIRDLNLWLEDRLDAERGRYPKLLWTHGNTESTSFDVYPFRPLFADHFEDPNRSIQWFHRSEQDSTETSVWSIYRCLHSDDATVRHKTEAWLCYGYLLYLWGSKAGREGANVDRAYPAGQVRERMSALVKMTDVRLQEKLSTTKDLVMRVALIESWLEPPSGFPIEDARTYFDQNASGNYGFIPVEFVYPLSWHIPRHQGGVKWVVKDYEEDMDYDCNMLLDGMMPDDGLTITKAWMVEVYLHFLAGKLLMDGKLPPWLPAEAQSLVRKECEKWISEMLLFSKNAEAVVKTR